MPDRMVPTGVRRTRPGAGQRSPPQASSIRLRYPTSSSTRIMPTMALGEGELLGGYRIVRLIGRGGMGSVYLADDVRLGRKVALKLLPQELADDPTLRARFIAESRLAASLDHPHIVPIYEAGTADGRLFLAMRYVAGADLEAIVAREGRLAPERAVGLLRGIADALDAAHAERLVHRDVKPANILIATTPSGEHAYLGDFGLARPLGAYSGFTGSGALVGSVDYVSPEVIEGGEAGIASDEYSLAGTLYTCIVGTPPFRRATEMGTLYAHVHAPRPTVEAGDSAGVPVGPVIVRGLAIAPGERYPTAGALLAAATLTLSVRSAVTTHQPARNAPTVVSPPAPAAPLTEERKMVSVLFCDLAGFTATSDQSDPEDVRARLRPYHARLRREIEGYGGTVEKFIGDAVMAVWGAPLAREDDAQRAVGAGLRILESIDEMNLDEPHLDLAVRIGITTGEALVVLNARPELGESLVAGDVVNTAARIQGAAPVGGLVVGEPTFRATATLFDYTDLPAAALKGKVEPVRLWRVLAAKARSGSSMTRTQPTALVGRELERGLLRTAFDRAVRDSTIQFATVVGEAGIGKSRLVADLFRELEERPPSTTWRHGRCLPYGDGISFWALGEIVKAETGILESDSSEAAAIKLDAAIASTEPNREWLKARLRPLVGLETAPSDQEESFTAWRQFLESLAVRNPTVLVFEDLHWADEALLAFLNHILDWAEGLPLLIVCTARPEIYERHPEWAAGRRNMTLIDLARLSDVETAELASTLLGDVALPNGTRELLIERAGGNPLYVGEFVRLLRDRGLLDAALTDLPLPDTMQAIIAARLDTLPADRKAMLQDAAVVGRTFWVGAVSTIGRRDPANVAQALHELVRNEVVRPVRASSMAGEPEYAFSHVLVRDVCYGQIPRAARAAKHIAAGEWIAAIAGSRLGDVADVLVHHYSVALQLARAADRRSDVADLEDRTRRFLMLAGDRAIGLDVARAEASYARALELAPVGHPDRPAILAQWAAAAAQRPDRAREAVSALDEAVATFQDRGEKLAAGRALVALSGVLSRLGDSRTNHVIEQAVAVLAPEPPGPDLVAAYAGLAASQAAKGDYRGAILSANQALDVAADVGLPVPPRALGYRGLFRCIEGDATGLQDMHRALDLALDLGTGRDTAILYANIAYTSGLMEGPAKALAARRGALEFARQRGMVDLSEHNEANIIGELYDVGEWDQALLAAESLASRTGESSHAFAALVVHHVPATIFALRGEALKAQAHGEWLENRARAATELQWSIPGWCGAAAVFVASGELSRAEAALLELSELAAVREEPSYMQNLPGMVRIALACAPPALARRLVDGAEGPSPVDRHALLAARAAVAEADGDFDAAIALYDEAEDRWRNFGNIPELGFALLGHGRSLIGRGSSGAERVLAEAREIFDHLAARPLLMEIDRLLTAGRASLPLAED